MTERYALVCEKSGSNYQIYFDGQRKKAKLRGSVFHNTHSKDSLPCVGDWVAINQHNDFIVIEGIEKRRSLVSRRMPGGVTEQQAIAANVDFVVIVLSLDRSRHYSDRLLERLLTVAWSSGATPLVVLNKADLNSDAMLIKRQLETIALEIDIIVCSVQENIGVDRIFDYISNGKVGVFIGPSGVGKSTLTNTLLEKHVQKTNTGRKNDGRGRHTTSGCYLFELNNGGFIIDSAGLKEVQAWATIEDIDAVFEDISNVSGHCRYRDCKHQGEPGCAVQAELEEGNITPERYDNYLNLMEEQGSLMQQHAARNGHIARKMGRKITKMRKAAADGKRQRKEAWY